MKTLLMSFLLSLSATLHIMHEKKSMLLEWTIMMKNSAYLSLPLMMDIWSMMFLSLVLFISMMVFTFSKSYMKEEKQNIMFYTLLFLFILSMLLLIMIPNLMTILIGWDGLGITSFLLVMFYQNKSSLGASLLTVLSNRAGDVFLIMAIFMLLNSGHWTSISTMSDMKYWMPLFLLLAAMTKSAQFPFSAWLPAAMAAPTPVSALVHSSTLVTAGVYLLFRFYPAIKSTQLNMMMMMIGVLTMVMAGMLAMGEMDMKKVIALSTLSQMGLMITTLGLDLPTLTFFHLCTHALFKSLLFICAGTIINLKSHNQDMRTLHSAAFYLPYISSPILVANMSMCAFPFLAGFYSKDQIIESFMTLNMSTMSMMFMLLGLMLTTMYSIRMTMLLISQPPSMVTTSYSTSLTLMPTNLLALAAIIMGATINWMLGYFNLNILSLATKLLPMALLTVMMSMSMMALPKIKPIKYSLFMYSTANMMFLKSLFSNTPMKMSTTPTMMSLSSTDQGWLTLWGPTGLPNLMYLKSKKVTLMDPLTPLKQMSFLTMFILMTEYFLSH